MNILLFSFPIQASTHLSPNAITADDIGMEIKDARNDRVNEDRNRRANHRITESPNHRITESPN
jgi:hypothetical protein